MKIYPGTHKPYFKKQSSLKDIPLAYVYNDEIDRIIDVKISSEFNKPYTEENMRPYQTVEDNTVLFFDKNDMPIWNSSPYLQQFNAQWYVLPKYITEFYPQEFTYSVLVQRNDTYKRSVQYPLSIYFDYDTLNTNSKIQNALSSLMQKQDTTKQYPNNIVFNEGDVTLSAFANMDPNMCDFAFYPANNLSASEINDKVNKHINLWLYADTFTYQDGDIQEDLLQESDDKETSFYRLESQQIFSDNAGYALDIKKDGKYLSFRTESDLRWNKLSEDYKKVELFLVGSPVQIYYKENGGYVILSHTSFIENLAGDKNNNAQLRLFFEVLFYVYLHGYYETQTATSWITDEGIDYYLYTVQPYHMAHPKINLTRLLSTDGYNTQINYNIVHVTTKVKKENANFTVQFTGTTRFNDLVFKKEAPPEEKDPAKGNNILVYTVNHSLLLYNPAEIAIRKIETGIYIRQIDQFNLGIAAAKSSKYKIYTTEEQIVPIPEIGNYVIYYDTGSQQFISSQKIEDDNQYVKVASVSVQINTDIIYKDIRKPGGGEASTEPNYEMIDTGNLYGRPYRYGCPMIIQLPARYKPMQKEIRSEVEKHIASGDYPIILYKD